MDSVALADVLERPDVWRGDATGHANIRAIASGFRELDAELPGGGWPAGALTEILPAHEGIGELRLLGPALAALAQSGAPLAWIAPPHCPYAPALAAAGIDPAKLVIVHAGSEKEALWAAEQALRSNACGAVLAWPRRARYAELRRLQVAAEGGRGLALLFRPREAARESSPAALRIAVDTHCGGLALSLLKRRGGPLASPLLLPPLPPAARHRPLEPHVDRRPLSAPAARDLPARLVHA
jgi:protein ImuA